MKSQHQIHNVATLIEVTDHINRALHSLDATRPLDADGLALDVRNLHVALRLAMRLTSRAVKTANA